MKNPVIFQKDTDIVYPYQNRPLSGSANLTIINSRTARTPSFKDDIQRAANFTSDDFFVAGLDDRIPTNFGDNGSIEHMARIWEERANSKVPTAAYFLSEFVFKKHVVGMVNFSLPTNAPRFGTKKITKTRLLSGWFNYNMLQTNNGFKSYQSEESFAVNSLRLSLAMAAASGIENVELLVPHIPQDPNPALIVIQNAVDPAQHGFKPTGEIRKISNNQRDLSMLWTRKTA